MQRNMKASRLMLVHGEELSRTRELTQIPSLASQPFRPGEMPEAVLLELPESVAGVVAVEANTSGLPPELFVRIAVESTRHLRNIARVLAVTVVEAAGIVERGIEDQDSGPAVVEARRQQAYAKRVRAATIGRGARAVIERITVLLPDAMLAGWAVDAAAECVPLDEFIFGCIREAPSAAVTWEAAAAARGLSLGEAMYAATLANFRPR
jgi:hypothetical protein